MACHGTGWYEAGRDRIRWEEGRMGLEEVGRDAIGWAGAGARTGIGCEWMGSDAIGRDDIG